MAAIIHRHSIAAPGRRAIHRDPSLTDRALQHRERRGNTLAELAGADCVQLSFGIVQVVDVDSFEAKILAARLDHSVEVSWRYAMRALHEVARRDNAWPDEVVFEPAARIWRH